MIARGCEFVVGLDTERHWVTLAQQEVAEACFIQGSALALPFQEALFDLVTLFDVVEHVPRGTERHALSEAGRVLRDGGSLVVSVPNSGLLSNLLDPARWLIGHRHYTPEQVVELLNQEGFAVDQVECRGGLAELVGMLLLYVFKVFAREMPFKRWFDRQRDEEYLGPNHGTATIFVVARRVAS